MTRRRIVVVALGAGFLLAACAGTGLYSIPRPIADAQPFPTRCPDYVPGCAPPPSTHSPDPGPEPTTTNRPGPSPRKTLVTKPGRPTPGAPTTQPTSAAGPLGPGGPTPPPGSKFVAFNFQSLPFEQAFPLDPPPPPPPVRALPTPLVSLAAVLAAGVAASAGISSRRRERMLVV